MIIIHIRFFVKFKWVKDRKIRNVLEICKTNDYFYLINIINNRTKFAILFSFSHFECKGDTLHSSRIRNSTQYIPKTLCNQHSSDLPPHCQPAKVGARRNFNLHMRARSVIWASKGVSFGVRLLPIKDRMTGVRNRGSHGRWTGKCHPERLLNIEWSFCGKNCGHSEQIRTYRLRNAVEPVRIPAISAVIDVNTPQESIFVSHTHGRWLSQGYRDHFEQCVWHTLLKLCIRLLDAGIKQKKNVILRNKLVGVECKVHIF